PFHVWLTQVGTGRFVNLTNGEDDRHPVRGLGFSADGSEIWLGGAWFGGRPGLRLPLMPMMGGAPRTFLADNVVNVAWSPDGTRLAYHTNTPGDPMFVADRTGANPRQIFAGRPGVHNHYPTWSQDGQWIYFISGIFATHEMDLWRISSSGGEAERLTQHNNDVVYVAPLDSKKVLYITPAEDGSGPWLWAVDPGSKIARRLSFGLEKYTSVAASV